MCIVVIHGKCKANNLRKKNYKFSELILISVSVYYELKLKGFAYLEIFFTNYKAIKLWFDLVGSIKKLGKITLWTFIINTTTQPS